MATAAYARWKKDGKPVSGLSRPVRVLRDFLRAKGYTVYDIGNDDHLEANVPLDHTPYAANGWPATSPWWWLHAIDIMPPLPGSGLPSLQRLGAQLLADRKAGRFSGGFKYMNWEPYGNYTGACFQESFKPNYAQFTSTDRGHIHLSGQNGNGVEVNGQWDSYPQEMWDRLVPPAPRPAPAPKPVEETMLILIRQPETGDQVFGTFGGGKWKISAEDLDDYQGLCRQGAFGPVWRNGEVQDMGGTKDLFGPLLTNAEPASVLTPQQVQEMASAVASAVVAADTNTLSEADFNRVEATVTDVLSRTRLNVSDPVPPAPTA